MTTMRSLSALNRHCAASMSSISVPQVARCILPRRVLAPHRVAVKVAAAEDQAEVAPSVPLTGVEAMAVGGPPSPATWFEGSEQTALPVVDEPLLLPAAGETGHATEHHASAVLEAAEEMSGGEIKAALLDSLYGTERGLAARSEVRAEINELITQLEAKNPTPSPTEALDKLDGSWRLVYTSSRSALAVLALARLPFVQVGDLVQSIDVATNTVENKVKLSGLISSTSFSTTSSFEVRSPKRLQFKLEKGTISTPSIVSEELVPPSSVTVMGRSLDLTQINEALKPVSDGLVELLSQAGDLLKNQPDLQIPLQSDRAETWQLNTYVDSDLRIMRGDGGAVFIAVKVPTSLPRAF